MMLPAGGGHAERLPHRVPTRMDTHFSGHIAVGLAGSRCPPRKKPRDSPLAWASNYSPDTGSFCRAKYFRKDTHRRSMTASPNLCPNLTPLHRAATNWASHLCVGATASRREPALSPRPRALPLVRANCQSAHTTPFQHPKHWSGRLCLMSVSISFTGAVVKSPPPCELPSGSALSRLYVKSLSVKVSFTSGGPIGSKPFQMPPPCEVPLGPSVVTTLWLNDVPLAIKTLMFASPPPCAVGPTGAVAVTLFSSNAL